MMFANSFATRIHDYTVADQCRPSAGVQNIATQESGGSKGLFQQSQNWLVFNTAIFMTGWFVRYSFEPSHAYALHNQFGDCDRLRVVDGSLTDASTCNSNPTIIFTESQMLLRVDANSRSAVRVAGEQLKDFGLDERGLQDILFRSLDRLLPDEELLLIAQSRRWQEEPDLLALDERGRLYIFEIKVWESRSENLLQALRYGQIFGSYDYASLDQLFRRFEETGRSLAEAHRATFGVQLNEADFNSHQTFVVLTNGLDFKTRQAIQYWRRAKLDVQPWVYRVYPDSSGTFLLEVARFSVEDNPYEDAKAGFYVLNTNFGNDPTDHEDMLRNRKAAAYFSPWKHKVEQLSKGDTVFLYQSGVGIVAMGRATGKLGKAAYHGDSKHADEEYYMTLDRFRTVDPPVSAAEIKEVTSANYVFRGTMFSMDAESGDALIKFLRGRQNSEGF